MCMKAKTVPLPQALVWGQGGLKDISLSLDPHILEGISLAVPVIKEELFASLNCPLGKDPNPMISVHHDHFGITVGVH